MKRAVLLAGVALLAAACSGGDYSGLSLDDPWTRPTPQVATTAAFFLTIRNGSDVDETLVSATTDACRVTEFHESSMNDGVMRMREVPGGILIAASTTVIFQPGGLHIMCIDKIAEFAMDDKIDVTLEFVSGEGESHLEAITAVVEDR